MPTPKPTRTDSPKRKEPQILNPNTRRQLEQIDEGTGQTYGPPKEDPKRKRGSKDGATIY